MLLLQKTKVGIHQGWPTTCFLFFNGVCRLLCFSLFVRLGFRTQSTSLWFSSFITIAGFQVIDVSHDNQVYSIKPGRGWVVQWCSRLHNPEPFPPPPPPLYR